MKKIFYSILLLSMVFTSCNPLEDINTEIDALSNADAIVGDVNYTFTPEDYTTKKSKGGFFEFNNEYFSSIQDVESMMPAFLSDKYPALGVKWKDGKIAETSLAIINYNLKSPIKMETYSVTNADYTSIGLTSLNSNADFNKLLTSKFPGVDAGTIVELTYKTKPTINNYELVDTDYDLVGNGRFDNFDIRTGKAEETIEARRVKIQTIILNKFPTAVEGDKYNVTYKAFNDSFNTVTLEMLVKLTKNTPGSAKDYELVNADYTSVGNGRFFNFDIRTGKAEETIEARRVKIETILLNKFPSAVAGEFYKVTYKAFNNSFNTVTLEMLLEFNGTCYDLFSPLTYDLYTFALENATSRFAFNNVWDSPKTFTAADYTAMGQRFPNFSNSETALHRIAIYLKTLYPYATADMFIPVEYDQFRVGKVNVNFIFDGTNWNGIPEVIKAKAQFSHTGTTWEFDNTIKYTLTNGDYTLVGNGNFNNFDVRAGKGEEKESVRLDKINTILLNNFPGAAEDQKYSVSYNVWKPGDDVFVMNVIKKGAKYELQ